MFALSADRRYWFFMRTQPVDAAPPSHAEVVARVGYFVPAIGRAVAATPPGGLVPFAVHARPAPRDLGHGRLIRVGDAAHAMEPNLGQGACQAIEDAVALAIAAEGCAPADIPPVFKRMRLMRVAMIVRRAAEGRHGAHGPPAAQWAMRTLLRNTPSRVSEGLARTIQTIPDYRI